MYIQLIWRGAEKLLIILLIVVLLSNLYIFITLYTPTHIFTYFGFNFAVQTYRFLFSRSKKETPHSFVIDPYRNIIWGFSEMDELKVTLVNSATDFSNKQCTKYVLRRLNALWSIFFIFKLNKNKIK